MAAAVAQHHDLEPRFGAVVIDHQLQAGSDAVAAQAAQQCRQLGLDPVIERQVQVRTGAGNGGLEQAARLARRAALLEAADHLDASAVWLAHTREDQAETVLLGLLRGSGPRSMAGMRRHDGIWERPLLGLSRALVRASLAQYGLQPFEDPHNENRAFSRVRIRHDVLPLLERELGGHIVEQLVRSAELFRDDTDTLDAMAQQWWTAQGQLGVNALHELPRALRTRVIRLALLESGCPSPEKDHIDAVDHLAMEPRARGPVRLPGMLQARRDRTAGLITIVPR